MKKNSTLYSTAYSSSFLTGKPKHGSLFSSQKKSKKIGKMLGVCLLISLFFLGCMKTHAHSYDVMSYDKNSTQAEAVQTGAHAGQVYTLAAGTLVYSGR